MTTIPSSMCHFYGVILAGGWGTRFWPRSRKALPKQLLPIVGEKTLLRQTFERLQPLVRSERIWVLTSESLRGKVLRELPEVPRRQIIAEPVQRNTAPAIALAARLLLEQDSDALMGVFPSDHLIQKPKNFAITIRKACIAAQAGQLIVLGIEPTRPETGFGYIEFASGSELRQGKVSPVVGFFEKPKLAIARRYSQAKNFFWNSGIFIWQAQTFQESAERFLPRTTEALSHLLPLTSRQFRSSLIGHYPNCDSISVDYGILERSQNISGIACRNLGWSDLGSWEAVYQLSVRKVGENILRSATRSLMAEGNLVDVPGKLTALVGVKDLAVIETSDALLVCHRGQAQKIAELVKHLESEDLQELL